MVWINILNEIFLYFPLKEAPMAKYSNKAVGKVAGKCLRNADAKESAMLRNLRIDGSQNGATLRTRVVRDKTKYNRNVKHKKSFADARDFAFIGIQLFKANSKCFIVLHVELGCSWSLL